MGSRFGSCLRSEGLLLRGKPAPEAGSIQKKKKGCETVQTDLTLCHAIALEQIIVENYRRIGAKIDFSGYFPPLFRMRGITSGPFARLPLNPASPG
jgi:hypothetical protein